MAAVLRASGPDFDVDAFVTDCDWRIEKVFHRGEALLPQTRPDGRKRHESGLTVVVSEADFHEFAKTHNAAEVRRLVAFSGVKGVVLDFAIE